MWVGMEWVWVMDSGKCDGRLYTNDSIGRSLSVGINYKYFQLIRL